MKSRKQPGRSDERGYTLVALLALMTIIMLAITAAAPSLRQQRQRELEREAIARGEEVAEAIAMYVNARKVLPTSIEQLLEGIPVGTKKVHILRASAARDPLSSTGEWRYIKPRSPELIEFQRAVTLYAQGMLPPGRNAQFMQLCGVAVTGVVDTGTKEEAPGGEDDSTNMSGPFCGVASRSRRESVLAYYGIERHDEWVFTPLFR